MQIIWLSDAILRMWDNFPKLIIVYIEVRITEPGIKYFIMLDIQNMSLNKYYFGCIYSHIGGMAAGSHLKTLVSILLSLSSDPHPVVHFWALYALAQIIESAGLMFSQY